VGFADLTAVVWKKIGNGLKVANRAESTSQRFHRSKLIGSVPRISTADAMELRTQTDDEWLGFR
jgi:hypothetical protein